ncbi:MAG: N-6 DNA methylase, partial [Selenomonadaceae bacterium]|nr:N-6 DNA methylase [Selenomonadaceae bacterium]
SFLIAAMNHMLKTADDYQKKNIRQNQLHGIELRPDMFSTATTNMILRGDGKSNLICEDFFAKKADDLQLRGLTVGFMNPPYSQAKNAATSHLSELNFIRHLLESITKGGRVAVIVPVSAMIGKTRDDKIVKGDILKSHTLEGVISLNKNTFYGIGTVPCIAVFTAGEPHHKSKRVKFINFEDDGFEVKKHVGLVETERAKDKKFYLLDCWHGKIKDAPSKFMVETTIEPQDEWLHSFYYYNDELPEDNSVHDSTADYLTFEFNMIAHRRDYLFGRKKKLPPLTEPPPPFSSKRWKAFLIGDLFNVKIGKPVIGNTVDKISGHYAYVTRKESNNGVDGFIDYDENFLNVDFPVITVGAETAMPFVQNFPFFTGVKVNILSPKKSLSRFTLMFIAQSIKMQREKFTYAFALISSRLKKLRIFLPVTDNDTPDYEYMENYVRAVEEEILQRYREFVSIANAAQVPPLKEKVWRAFFIGDLFRLETGKAKGLNHLEQDENGISYLGATNRNNAVLTFVK